MERTTRLATATRRLTRWQRKDPPHLVRSGCFKQPSHCVGELSSLPEGHCLLVPQWKGKSIYRDAARAGWPPGRCRIEWVHRLDGYVVSREPRGHEPRPRRDIRRIRKALVQGLAGVRRCTVGEITRAIQMLDELYELKANIRDDQRRGE